MTIKTLKNILEEDNPKTLEMYSEYLKKYKIPLTCEDSDIKNHQK
jgi:hypothetical protein